MSNTRKTLSFSAGTLISRITGLFRDITLASVFGASSVLDAYYIAIVFPFFLRRTFAEGAMSSAFLPIYNQLKTKEEKERFTSAVLTSLGLITLGVVIFSEIFPRFMVSIFATGAEESIRSLASSLLRITAPFISIVFVWAVFYSIHNSQHRYFLPALTPMFSNIGVIMGSLTGDIKWSAFGFTAGGLIALLVLLPYREGFKYRPTFRGLKKFYRMFFATFLTMAVSQIATLVDVNVSSFLDPGSLSLIQLSSRLYQLPLGIFGVAVSTVALSTLSQVKEEEFNSNLSDFIIKSLFLTIPSTVGLIVLSKRLLSLLFGYGAFTSKDVKTASEILSMYALGLCFVALFHLLSRAYHAKRKARIPFLAMLLVSVVNVCLDVVLGLTLRAKGIALATSVSYIVGFFFLFFKMKPSLDNRIFKILVSAIVMGVTLLLIKNLFTTRIGTVFLVFLGAGTYIGVGKILKLREVEEIFRTKLH
ncbi:murein biosynthesis integral membrane protein MurJ [Thermotoga sp. KOL6]|uniref:murein biosynthesis integral membrane protein MurJ n=1 Tax=Thermotoga sp. KOL6 TaxID=126741 RepID=UPI000C76158F|nr:murein biosynthesis integral membrane protein MurJ [Thermotoga sp. KOL6]PLV58684.1 multidrug transporter MurJ [Thermotoga sp. KOL6]